MDYASPNMSKALHVGHMRTILIGDCVARILERLGHQVDRVRYVLLYACIKFHSGLRTDEKISLIAFASSHVGDFGTPIAMVLVYLFQQKPNNWREW